jgi:hypothetical protein
MIADDVFRDQPVLAGARVRLEPLNPAATFRIGLIGPRRVYDKYGFVHEGVRRDPLHWEGAWHDAIVMAILATDPRPAAT